MNIELCKVSYDEKEQLGVLVSEYLKEHSQYQRKRIGPESVEEYVYFPEYWKEKGRFPFFIRYDGKTIGFVLVRTVFEECDCFYQLAEFYVEPAYQRRGLGKKTVHLLWDSYPGRWELQVLAENVIASKFWSECAATKAAGKVQIIKVEGLDGLRYQFNFEIP